MTIRLWENFIFLHVVMTHLITFFLLYFRFKEQSNIPYSEMLFFDDEYRNIVDLNSIGRYHSLENFFILRCDSVSSNDWLKI